MLSLDFKTIVFIVIGILSALGICKFPPAKAGGPGLGAEPPVLISSGPATGFTVVGSSPVAGSLQSVGAYGGTVESPLDSAKLW